MPLVIQRDSIKFTFKKRHFALFFSIGVFSVIVYRACFIAYYFSAIELGKCKIEKVSLVQDKREYDLAFSSADAKPFSAEIKMNFSKCMCPLFLEIMDINASLFLVKPTNSTESLLQIAVSDIKLQKKKPFAFRAKAEFKNINFSTPVLDLLSMDFVVEFSFIIRARFCYIPLCFSKVISRKKSDIVRKGVNSLSMDFLSTRLHRLDDVPCVQIGLKKKFFSVVNTGSAFTFNAGCIKLSFEGFLNFFVLITSFSTDNYLEFSKEPRPINTFEELTSIIPGEPIVEGLDPDDSVVFYFISIPISNLANLVQATTRLSDNTRKFLRLKMISALLVPAGTTEKYTSFLSESLKRSERIYFDIEEQKAFNVIRIVNKVSSTEMVGLHKWKAVPEFIDTWSLYKLVLMKASTNTTPLSLNFNMSVYDWKSKKNSISFKMGLYNDHPLWILFSRLLHADELVNNPLFRTSFSLEVALYNLPYMNLSFSLMKSQPEDQFQNILTVNIKALKKLLLRPEDICQLQLRPKSFKFGKYIVIIENIFALSIDYPKSINLIDPCGATFPIYLFRKEQEHSIIASHNVTNYPASSFVKIDTTVDMSTYGFHNVSNHKNKSIFSPSSSIKLEIPEFSFSITNSFLKIRSTPIPTTVTYFFSSQNNGPCFNGIFQATSVFAFQRSWDPSKEFIDNFLEEKLVFSTLNRIFALTFSFNDIIDDKKKENPDFLKILPFEIKFDPDFPYNSNNPTKMHIKHISQQNQETFEDYTNCKDPKLYRKHNLLNTFSKTPAKSLNSKKPASNILFIRNLVTAPLASFAAIANGVPLFLVEATDPSIVLTLTNNNLFIYFNDIVRLDLSAVSLDEMKSFRNCPRLWLEKCPLHYLIQFIIDAIIYKPSDFPGLKELLSKARRGKVETTVKIHPTQKKSISVNMKLKIPDYMLRKSPFVNLDFFCTAELHSIENSLSSFSSLFAIRYIDGNYVFEVSAEIPNSFVKTPTNLCVKFNKTYYGMVSTDLHNFFTDILPVLSFIKSSSSVEELTYVDYSSPAFTQAFGVGVDDYRGSLFSFDTRLPYQNRPIFSVSRKFCMPPAINLSIKDIEGFQNKIKLNMQLGIDAVTDLIGNVLFDIFFFLPVTVLPESFAVNVDIPEAFAIRVNIPNKQIFSINITEVQSNISIPVEKFKNHVTQEECADLNLLFESYRDKVNKNTEIGKNVVMCSIDLSSDGISHIVTSLIQERFQLSFMLSEPFETLSATFRNNDGGLNSPKFTIRCGSLPLLSFDVKAPFVLNFVGDPLYIFTYRKELVKLCFRTKGCFMDSSSAAEGYYLSIPMILNPFLSYKKDSQVSKEDYAISSFRNHGIASPHPSTYEDIFVAHKKKVICYPVFLINPNSTSFPWVFTALDVPLKIVFFGGSRQTISRNVSIILSAMKMAFGANIRNFIDNHIKDTTQVHYDFHKDFDKMAMEMEEIVKKCIVLAYTT